MKDIVITAKQLRRERNLLLALFVVAFLVNVGAIVGYDRPWSELFSQLGFVVVITPLFYLLLWIPRGLVRLLLCVFRARK